MTHTDDLDVRHMRRAIQLAEFGRGYVEPNPLVGCVIADGQKVIAEGRHRRFGGPHAEIEALRAAGKRAAGATMYVSLEPCCHRGKTPPCTEAVAGAGIRRVVVACEDPFPEVAGGGIRRLKKAGLRVDVGLLADEARRQNAPYFKLVRTGRPWIIAKWAMTLDGRIATRTGQSHWISGEASRSLGHTLRGRVSAIMIGSGTARADDPLLTARPPGPRVAMRIVLNSRASLSSGSRLVKTAREVPLLVAVGPRAPESDRKRLTDAGAELFVASGAAHSDALDELLGELGRRRMTNVLVEGGSHLLGNLFDAQAVDEVHVFIAPKLIGGASAPGPIAGVGIEHIQDALALDYVEIKQLDRDFYLHGVVRYNQA